MTFFALVRHGETDWNVHGRLQGSSDIPLNDTGRAQAREAAHLLRTRSWDSIVASPLSRAYETAEIIGAELGLPVSDTDPALVERHYGAAEGLTEWEAYDNWPWGDYPGLEPRPTVARRGVTAVSRLAESHPDTAIVVVTHGGVIRAILDVMHHRRAPRILNAAVSTISFDGARWHVHSINEVYEG